MSTPGKIHASIKEEGPEGRFAVRIVGRHPDGQGDIDDTEYVDGFYSACRCLVENLTSHLGPFDE